MEDTQIEVALKIEIREGGTILIPGCEPTSELTSPLFAQRLNCNASEITAKQAMKLMPGSYIYVNPFSPSKRFLVLPSGPPPYGNDCQRKRCDDWYAYLREAVTPSSETSPLLCNAAAFDFSWCKDVDREAAEMAK